MHQETPRYIYYAAVSLPFLLFNLIIIYNNFLRKKMLQIYTTRLLIMFNVGAYGLILLSTSFIPNHSERLTVVGWICAVFSVSVFAAPLAIMVINYY